MTARELYQGHTLQAVDDKGRVAIPGDLRAALEANSTSRSIMIGPHAEDPCMVAHDIEWSRIQHAEQAELKRLALIEGRPVDTRAARNLHGQLDRATCDSSWRFVLSAYQREEFGIDGWVYFVGAAEVFELWSPRMLIAADHVHEGIKRKCRHLCAQKGVAL